MILTKRDFCKKLVLVFLVFTYGNVCAEQAKLGRAKQNKPEQVGAEMHAQVGNLEHEEDSKSLISIIERKSVSHFNNVINLMCKCDKYIEFWQYRKKNLSLYVSKSLITGWHVVSGLLYFFASPNIIQDAVNNKIT